MTPREEELLRGMGNCYTACGEDFEHTVGMVARARDLTPEYVKSVLRELRQRNTADPQYKRLRSRLPPDFPI